MSILLDAEQSHRQPAIDYIARELMHEFNQVTYEHADGTDPNPNPITLALKP